MDEIKTNIVALNAETAETMSEQDAYIELPEDYQGPIAPENRIPGDILRAIFSLCLPGGCERGMIRASEAPMLLSHVCRHWRALALDTPTLWSYLYLFFPSYPDGDMVRILHGFRRNALGNQSTAKDDKQGAEESLKQAEEAWTKNMQGQAQLVSLWLSRAKGCPLHFVVVEGPGPTVPKAYTHWQGPDESPVKILLDLVQRASERWQSLSLMANIGSPLESLFTLPPERTAQLDLLYLRWYELFPSQEAGEPAIPVITTVRSQNLSRLCLHNFTNNFSQIPARWNTLTELSLFGLPFVSFSATPAVLLSATAALKILSQCSALVRCELQIASPFENQQPGALPNIADELGTSSTLIRLGSLQSLTVIEDCFVPIPEFYQALDVPSLCSLVWGSSYSHVEAGVAVPKPSILPLLKNWGHQLTSLEFPNSKLLVDDFLSCLGLVPGLTRLTVTLSALQRSNQPSTNFNPPSALEHAPNTGAPSVASRRDATHPSTKWRSEWLPRLYTTGDALCPNLKVLRVTTKFPQDIDIDALHTLVSGRNSHADFTPFKRVIIRFSLEGDSRLRELEERTHTILRNWRDVFDDWFGAADVVQVKWKKAEEEVFEAGSRSVLPATNAGLRVPAILPGYIRTPLQSPWEYRSFQYEDNKVE